MPYPRKARRHDCFFTGLKSLDTFIAFSKLLSMTAEKNTVILALSFSVMQRSRRRRKYLRTTCGKCGIIGLASEDCHVVLRTPHNDIIKYKRSGKTS